MDKIKSVIFDLDGTLLDTIEDIRYALNYALSCYDIEKASGNETRRYVGSGLRLTLARAIAEKSRCPISEEDQELMYRLMIETYRRHPATYTCKYDGIDNLLGFLASSGVKVSILSNKDDDLVVLLAERFFPDFPFSVVRGKRPSSPLKPSSELSTAVMADIGVDAAHTLFVGDSEVDYRTAEAAFARSIIVTYGFRDASDLSRVVEGMMVSSPLELQKALSGLI